MSELKKLGLTGYEEAVYTALLTQGSSTAKDLAVHAKLLPTAVYPNLRSLVAKGLVQRIDGDPARFAAIDPAVALPAFAEKKADAALEAARALIPKLALLSASGPQHARREPVSVTLGTEASSSITMAIASRSSRSFFVGGWGFSSKKNMHTLLGMLAGLARKGLDVRLILRERAALDEASLRAYLRQGIKIRSAPLIGFSIVLGDAKECKLTLKSPKIGERVNVHIEDEALCGALHTYFLSEWKKARPL